MYSWYVISFCISGYEVTLQVELLAITIWKYYLIFSYIFKSVGCCTPNKGDIAHLHTRLIVPTMEGCTSVIHINLEPQILGGFEKKNCTGEGDAAWMFSCAHTERFSPIANV